MCGVVSWSDTIMNKEKKITIYSLDYELPDDDYYIDTSLEQEEIDFYLELSETERYKTYIYALRRIAHFLERDFPQWKEFVRAFSCISVILVRDLSVETIHKAVAKAYATGFYDSQRSALQYAEMDQGMPELLSLSKEEELQNTGIFARSMLLGIGNDRYTLRIACYAEVQTYFASFDETDLDNTILAIPNLVLIRSWEDVTPEEIVSCFCGDIDFHRLLPD